MTKSFSEILQQDSFSETDIQRMLLVEGNEQDQLFARSAEIREKHVGNKVYLRGLIEISNQCRKDCLYCGIRKSNTNTDRYNLTDNEILAASQYAYNNKFGSVVLQGGELCSDAHIVRIEKLVKQIKNLSGGELGITLSLGEQSEDTYQLWYNAGAHRYLLRIETSNPELYYKIHPNTPTHSYESRLNSLKLLQKTGYQVGTGVMIGLPFQTVEDLANDLLFMKLMDIDMVGMGPYIEHVDTPLYKYKDLLLPIEQRYYLSMRMVAALRIIMMDINIAATTALQAIMPNGREMAIRIGANVIMPNITPRNYKEMYKLYENKPTTRQDSYDELQNLINSVNSTENHIALNEWGDSLRFKKKLN